MLIGVPREIKPQEFRVGLTPESVAELVHHGHKVLVETQAGVGIGARDADYQAVGAQIAADAQTVFARGELIEESAPVAAIPVTLPDTGRRWGGNAVRPAPGSSEQLNPNASYLAIWPYYNGALYQNSLSNADNMMGHKDSCCTIL